MLDRKFKITISLIVTLLIAIIIISYTGITKNLSGIAPSLIPWVVIGGGVLDSINPCAFSVLIITIAFLMNLGFSRKRTLLIGSIYIFGIFITYLLIGLGIMKTLTVFGVSNIMAKVSAILILGFGAINIINYLFPKFPIKFQIPEISKPKIAQLMHKATFPAFFILGCLVGLSEVPCTVGPYLLILGLLHDNQTLISGFLYLLLYNFIFILPLILILSLASDKSVLDKINAVKKEHSKSMKLWGGIIMLLLGILILIL